MIVGLIILSTFVGLFAFLGVQTNTNGRQDSVANNLKAQLQYVSDEVDMLKMGGTNSTLLESGVCQLLQVDENFFFNLIPLALVNYSLFSNTIRSYVVFQNTSLLSIPSFPETGYQNPVCPYFNDYNQQLSVAIGACTTDLTGTNLTVNYINDLRWNNDYGSILTSDQLNINIGGQNLIFVGSGNQCNQNQVFFSSTTLNYGFVNTMGQPIRLNYILFDMLFQNTSTTFSITKPIMLLLPNIQNPIK